MDIEKFINEKGVAQILLITTEYEKGKYIGYRYHDGNVKVQPYDWRYIYDGVEFIGGRFGMIEIATCFSAVNTAEIKGKVTADKVIAKFKEKVSRCGRSVPAVVRDTRIKNLDLETWLINSLII